MKKRGRGQIFLGFLCFICLAAASFGKVTAIKAGILINPKEGKAQSGIIILIEGEQIKAVGEDINIPEEAEIIDLSGMCVLPGLIDCHVHLCDSFDAKKDVGGELLLYNLTVSTADRAMHGIANARSMLESGFTTVRDMGNAGNFADAALRRAIDKHIVTGPKYFISGKIIAPFGGQYALDPEFPDIGRHDYFYADTRDEMKKAIRQNIHFGADWIKIIVDDYLYIYSAEDIRFMVEEAAKAGLRVAAHCVTEQGAHNAAEARLASIEHGFAMSDKTLTLAKQNGVVLVATDFTEEIMDIYNFFTATHADIVDRLKRAYRIGIPLCFGSDIIAEIPGHTRGSAALSLLDSWVEAGISNPDILRALTTNGAQLLGISDERGALRAGMMADIIAVPENPLDRIQNLKGVKFVMKEGHICRHIQ